MYKAIIFDLDGTLTDTLRDLYDSVNYALRKMGFPERTMDEVRNFVGNGIHRLIERAVPKDTSEEVLEMCFAHFREHYVVHCQDHTCLYPGIDTLLKELHERGIKLAIVSNKLQAGVDELYATYFQNTVNIAIGEQEGLRRKPSPDMIEFVLKKLGINKEEALYVGDSEVDIATANNAGLPCISVLWGFRHREELTKAGATSFISHPHELLELL